MYSIVFTQPNGRPSGRDLTFSLAPCTDVGLASCIGNLKELTAEVCLEELLGVVAVAVIAEQTCSCGLLYIIRAMNFLRFIRRDVSVVYLARKVEGLSAFQRFYESYQGVDSGVRHDLVVIYKGFEDDPDGLAAAKRIFPPDAACVMVPDNHFDIGAYLIAAHQLRTRYVCFLNTFTTILADKWLAYLHKAIKRRRIGLAGATGSFESIYDSLALTSKSVWLTGIQGIPYDETLARHYRFILSTYSNDWLKGKPEGESPPPDIIAGNWAKYWEWSVSEAGPYRFLKGFPRFPNPHVRSNGFIVDRQWLTDHFPTIEPDKHAAFAFESGMHSISRTVQAEGRSLAIVDRSGRIYPVHEWEKSRTFRLGNQDGLLIADNQTRKFDAYSPEERNVLAMMSWGHCVAGVPDLGYDFRTEQPREPAGLFKRLPWQRLVTARAGMWRN
jgi:hypothetical protein